MRTIHASSPATLALVLLVGCGLPAARAPEEAPPAAILPLRTLRLYETGVGYFERSGSLGGRTGASLPVPPGHLDDALASLVVLRGGAGGSVSGLSFVSSVTRAAARAHVGLPADPTSPIAFEDLLRSMKGERVTITPRGAAQVVAGRVVEVAMEVDEARARALAERKDAKVGDDPKHLVVTLMTDAGALTRLAAEDIGQVAPADKAFAARLDDALDALGTRSTRNPRSLRLTGDAQGEVTFGYVTETPIWRASYRLIEGGADGTAVLQGWALLHNDTEEDWRGVHLELVNGEPDSFVFPMAAPRYARRALVHPDNPLSTLPQLADTTADALWGDHIGEPLSLEGGGGGYGYGQGSLAGRLSSGPSVRMAAADGALGSSSLLDVGNLADLAPATGVEQGALFTYAIPGGLSLDAHSSALVPFVQRGVAAERVTFFAGPGQGGRSAVQFVNSTGQTLPTGTITVFGAGGFTGETSLDRLKPGERRFLQIGNDLDGSVTEVKTERREEARRLTLDGDRLQEHLLRTTRETWELENRGGSARPFYVVLDADKNAKVTGADRVDFDEATRKPIVVFLEKAKDKGTRTFVVVEGLARANLVDNLTEKSVRALLEKTSLPEAERAVLEQAMPRVRALDAARSNVAALDRTSEESAAVLERVREDLKALGGGGAGGAAAAPLVSRLAAAEDRVDAARRGKEAAEKTLVDRRDALHEALQKLVVKPDA